MSIVDNAVGYIADRWQYAQSAFKYRTPRKAPPYIVAELEKMSTFIDIDDLLKRYDDKKLQKLAIAIPWIYANIRRIANEVSVPDLSVVEAGSQEKDIDHEFERVLRAPNEFFGKAALLQYTIWVMMLSQQGAYWYIMPDFSGNGNVIREIWPVPMDKLKPVKHATQFISHYEYDRGSGRKPLKIDKRFICRFFFPDPRDFWKSLTPLEAARYGIELYSSIAGSQTSLFGRAGGVPLAVVSVDKDIEESDFAVVRQQLKEDWEEQKRIAVVRAGTMSIGHVGITNRELEVIASQEMNRDELDTIFMGFAWHADTSAGSMKEADRRIKETIIHPLLLLLADQIKIEILDPFYGGRYLAVFEDVRSHDRSLAVQEKAVYWKAASMNEARKELNKPEFTNEVIPGLGDLPVNLANNAQFMIAWLGLNAGRVNSEGQLPNIGNMLDSAAPERVVSMEAGEETNTDKSIDVDAALQMAINAELKRYRTVTIRGFARHAEKPEEIEFTTDVVPEQTMKAIKLDLASACSEDEIRDVFSRYIDVS